MGRGKGRLQRSGKKKREDRGNGGGAGDWLK